MNLFILLALTAGAALPVQTALNARLGRDLGNPVGGALASFIVGSLGLLIFMIVARTGLPSGELLGRIPAHVWLGGLLGAIYVVVMIVATPRLGVATTMGLVIAGQVAVSVILDHVGALGVPRHPVNVWRAAGMCLLVAGVVMVKRF